MKQPNNTTIYNTALYLRLSRDDELQGESGSIRTQRMMLREYAHVLERGQAEPQCEIKPLLRPAVPYIPLVISPFQSLPGAAVLLASLAEPCSRTEAGMCRPLPFSCRQCLGPQCLGLRPYHIVVAESLKLLPVA